MCSFTLVLLNFQRFVALCASGPAHRKAAPARGKLPPYEATSNNNIGFVALCASGPAQRKAAPALGKLPLYEASKQAKHGVCSIVCFWRCPSQQPAASGQRPAAISPEPSSASQHHIGQITRPGGMRGAFEPDSWTESADLVQDDYVFLPSTCAGLCWFNL